MLSGNCSEWSTGRAYIPWPTATIVKRCHTVLYVVVSVIFVAIIIVIVKNDHSYGLFFLFIYILLSLFWVLFSSPLSWSLCFISIYESITISITIINIVVVVAIIIIAIVIIINIIIIDHVCYKNDLGENHFLNYSSGIVYP